MATQAAAVEEGAEDGFVEEDGSQSMEGEERASMSLVPNVFGLSARAAVNALLTADLDPQLSGHGRVVAQTPSPGTSVRKGSAVSVKFE